MNIRFLTTTLALSIAAFGTFALSAPAQAATSHASTAVSPAHAGKAVAIAKIQSAPISNTPVMGLDDTCWD